MSARIMVLGDSLTQGGENLSTKHYAYRGPLQKKLRDNGYAYDFIGTSNFPTSTDADDNDHEGHSGYTIGGVDPQIDGSGFNMGITDNITRYLTSTAATPPDVILVLVGINDVFFNRVPSPPNPSTPDRLDRLIVILKAQRPNAKIVVSSLLKLPDETTPRPEAVAINARARALGEASASDNVFFVDLAAVNLTSSDYVDFVHLSLSGARKVADGWYAQLTAPQP